MIYFCPNCANFLPKNVCFFLFYFFCVCGGGREGATTPLPPTHAQMLECQKGPMDLGLYVRPYLCLPGSFLRIETLVFFLKISMLLGVHMTLRVNEPKFSGKISFRLIIAKNDPKMGFLGFFVESYHLICLILV